MSELSEFVDDTCKTMRKASAAIGNMRADIGRKDALIRELVGALDTLVSRVNKYADRCDHHGPSWEFTKLVNDAESSIEALARAKKELGE